MLHNHKRKIGKNVAKIFKSGLSSKHSMCIESRNIILETSHQFDEELVEDKVIKDLKTKEDLSADKIILHFLLHNKNDEISVEATKTCVSKDKLKQK